MPHSPPPPPHSTNNPTPLCPNDERLHLVKRTLSNKQAYLYPPSLSLSLLPVNNELWVSLLITIIVNVKRGLVASCPTPHAFIDFIFFFFFFTLKCCIPLSEWWVILHPYHRQPYHPCPREKLISYLVALCVMVCM